jgi:UDP-glucose 4-epimerase
MNPEAKVGAANPELHFNENVVATFNLLETMRRKGMREIVFASSSSVYGEPEEIPVGEDASLRAVSVYGGVSMQKFRKSKTNDLIKSI